MHVALQFRYRCSSRKLLWAVNFYQSTKAKLTFVKHISPFSKYLVGAVLQNFWQRQSARQVWQIHTHQMNACQELSREVKFDAAYTTQLQVLKLSRSPFAAYKIMLARFLVTASIQVQTF
jgi:hypothetical protein